jgi:hypothetical protein
MYLLAVALHCLVGAAVTGAAAGQSGEFRHTLYALGLGSISSVALKNISQNSFGLLSRLSGEESADEHR